MRILLCNERFLFRFGVDRVLIMYGQQLANRGHSVTVMANRYDRPVIETFADEIISVPTTGDYIASNEFTAEWLEENWGLLFDGGKQPDVAIIAGWPFLAAIPVFRKHGVKCLFNDYGVVPLDDYTGGHRQVLEHLVELRREFLPQCDHVSAISGFIADTQSRPEAGHDAVTANLLGADHMTDRMWNVIEDAASTGEVEAIVSGLRDARPSTKILVNLGRWEPGCYKNSDAVIDIADRLTDAGVEFAILILAPTDVELPDRHRKTIIPIGFPDDNALQHAMASADLGISVSLWEGFNLPLAEMQWLEKPVLCFDVGAHPEVVAHPWYLCRDTDELVAKASSILAGEVPDDVNFEQAIRRFKANFTWANTLDRLEEQLAALTAPRLPEIVVDISNAAIDTGNSGVIRVTRSLCRQLQRYCDPVFVVWDTRQECYVYPTASEYHQLAQFNGPTRSEGDIVSPDTGRYVFEASDLEASDHAPWLLLPETIFEQAGVRIRTFARANGFRLGAIFYDAIPLLRPDLVTDRRIRENHADYMTGLAQCDLVLPISEFSATCLKDHWQRLGLDGGRVETQLLPAEFQGADRRHSKSAAAPGKRAVSLLCVSTLEPRKNHLRLLDAVSLLRARRPELDFTLTLVGNRYAGGDYIVNAVEAACREDTGIRWLGIVDDDALARAYDQSDLTIYASEIEGFGMPILESIWYGKPCLCHSGGVMAELAQGGGVATVDMTDVTALSSKLEALIDDAPLRARLAAEAGKRKLKTWDDYIEGVLSVLLRDAIETPEEAHQEAELSETVEHSTADWQQFLYKGCLTAEWQMNDSERLGLMAVLARVKPKCAIEVGTYRGGSLSLIAQTAECVYSIDIDPDIPERYKEIANARFFTGPSDKVLPLLLKQLDERNVPVEFVLIDGDHSAEGVRRDIEIMLDYVPKRPMVMMMHDGFNPECRRGMTEARWARNPHVHFVDLDFIPGRIVEAGGGGNGEMWGGLALAYFSPVKREGDVHLATTSRQAFDRALAVSDSSRSRSR